MKNQASQLKNKPMENRNQMEPHFLSLQLYQRIPQLSECVQLARNEAYMDFSDYQKVRGFFLKHFSYFQIMPKSADLFYKKSNSFNQMSHSEKLKRNSHPIYGNSLLDCIKKQDRTIFEDLYHLALIAAKSHFLKGEYEQTKRVIEKILIFPCPCSYKLVYERTMLYLKTVYLLGGNILQFTSVIKQYTLNIQIWSNQMNLTDEEIQATLPYVDQMSSFYKNLKASIQLRQNENYLNKLKNILEIIETDTKNNKNSNLLPGIPFYLISRRWLASAEKHVIDSTKYRFPGFIINLDLHNHIFQFQPMILICRKYTDLILFPCSSPRELLLVTQKSWRSIQKILAQVKAPAQSTIKRFPVEDEKIFDYYLKSLVVKLIIQVKSRIFIMQFLSGLTWQRSVIPYLTKCFGFGQIKVIKKKMNRNNQVYFEEELITKGVLIPIKSRYRYHIISNNNYLDISTIISKFSYKYNLEYYSNDFQKQNTMELANGLIQLGCQKLFKKIGKGLTLDHTRTLTQILCVLQCLGSLKSLMEIFNRDNLLFQFSQWKQKDAEYSIAFSDWMKKMWFSDSKQLNYDCSYFVKYLFNNSVMQNLYGYQRLSFFPYVIDYSNTISNILQSIIRPLHYMADQKSFQMVQQALKPLYLRGKCDEIFKQHFPYQIYSYFTQFHGVQQFCPDCFELLKFNVQPKLSICLQIPQLYETITFNLVIPNYLKRRTMKFETSKKQQVGKSVQQITITLLKGAKFEQCLNFLFEEKLLSQREMFDVVGVIVNQQCEGQKINQFYNSIQPENEKKITIRQINKLMKQYSERKSKESGPNLKWFTFVYLMEKQETFDKIAFITFRNPDSFGNKGYPELIRIKNFTKQSISKEILSKFILNPQIQIHKFEVRDIENIISRCKSGLISFLVDIYTFTKIGSVERCINKIVLRKDIEKDNYVKLEQCLKGQFCQKFDKLNQSHPSQLLVGKKQESSVEGYIRCKKGDCLIKPKVVQRLLKLQKIIIISLNRYKEEKPYRQSTKVKFPEQLNARQFIQQSIQSVQNKNKKQKVYRLVSLILVNQKIGDQGNILKKKHASVVRCLNDEKKWLWMQEGEKKLIQLSDIDEKLIEVLIYQKKPK